METPVLSVSDFVRWSGYLASRVDNPESRLTGETTEVLMGKVELLGAIADSARPEINGSGLVELDAAIAQLDAATRALIASKYSHQ